MENITIKNKFEVVTLSYGNNNHDIEEVTKNEVCGNRNQNNVVVGIKMHNKCGTITIRKNKQIRKGLKLLWPVVVAGSKEVVVTTTVVIYAWETKVISHGQRVTNQQMKKKK